MFREHSKTLCQFIKAFSSQENENEGKEGHVYDKTREINNTFQEYFSSQESSPLTTESGETD